MILLDAVYINNSGGKILLDYLIESLESSNIKVTYLLDVRVRNTHPKIKSTNVLFYLDASLKKRHSFYKANKHTFSKVLCFANLPPSIRLDATVYTYFHQKLFLEIPKLIPFKQKVIFCLKAQIFKFLASNSDFWLAQTTAMQEALSKKVHRKSSVLVVPFYPELKKTEATIRNETTFLYVSSGSNHKNHKKLLLAFQKHFDNFKSGTLHITVGKEFVELNQMINTLITSGYPIINHGFVERNKLALLYNSCTFVVYPSLSESFGLGIIEALENDCKIIAANLTYTFAVCEPSLVFNPNEIESIATSFKNALEGNIKPSKQLVFNEIDSLITLLS